jgi:hypothetical protein
MYSNFKAIPFNVCLLKMCHMDRNIKDREINDLIYVALDGAFKIIAYSYFLKKGKWVIKVSTTLYLLTYLRS